MSNTTGNTKARVFENAFYRAAGKLMEKIKLPGRKPGPLDNAGTHVYLTCFWAQELAARKEGVVLN
ncbi:MAG: hypothetical protein G3M70_02020 [Candidatus Nitronauta litoralis]|uniref:Uncharacterized protein n=1 Tax=Candidatus Nitronauta litoralis TaxID=2705533 RepID=A0A7T0BTI2_9BACT|nr:MAG: hypothetical protein G3M70_02020 [Candidatus Nitronauta litoralis]